MVFASILAMQKIIQLVPNGFRTLVLAGAALLWFVAIPHARAAMDVLIPAVESGDYKYDGSAPAPVHILIEDGRKGDTAFAPPKIGISKLRVSFTKSGQDPLVFLGESIAAELTKHGIAASTKPSVGAEVMTIRVEIFETDVRFATGFGPTTTLTRLRTVVTYKGKSLLVSGAIVRSNVLKSTPKKDKKGTWHYVFGDAVHMVVREAAAKLNRHYWSLAVPDAKVDQMIAALPASPDRRTIGRVVDVACTNNLHAIKYLRSRTTHPDQTLRRAALWGLGLVGSNPEVPLLKKAAMEGGDGGLLMGLKSLGDIGTPEARAAMKEIEGAKRSTLSERGTLWLTAVLGLYR